MLFDIKFKFLFGIEYEILNFRTQRLEYTKKCGALWKTEDQQSL